jgi:hypothetical protein
MPNPYANYYEHHESRESICAPEHVPECSLCHQENATTIIEFEGKDVHVGDLCAVSIQRMNAGRVA